MYGAPATPWTIEVGYTAGACVAHCPVADLRSEVRLRPLAEQMAARGMITGSADLYDALDTYDDSAEADIESGAFGKRLKRLAKKAKNTVKRAAKKVAKVAKKVAKSKIVKGLYAAVKAAVPPPFNAAVAAVETGVRFAASIAKDAKKARALPLLQAAAGGGPQAKALVKKAAKKAGISTTDAARVAVAIKTAAAAKSGDKKANAVVAISDQIERARAGDRTAARGALATAAEAKLKKTFPNGKVASVTMPDGRTYMTAVIALA